MDEEWRDAPMAPDGYEVSSLGRVRSKCRQVPGRYANTRTVPERILKPGRDKDGYQRVVMMRDGIRLTVQIHRAVAYAFVGPRPEGIVIDHINMNKQDNRAINLRYVTPLENTAVCKTMFLGEGGPNTKLTESIVRAIRDSRRTGRPYYKIADDFDLAKSHVMRICKGQSWPHIPINRNI